MRPEPFPHGISLLGLALLGLLATAGCASLGPRDAGDRQAVIDRIVASSVKITLERDGRRVRVGTGVVVGRDPAGAGAAYVITSEHLLVGKPWTEVHVRPSGGDHTKLRAEVVRRGDAQGLDIALLRVPGLAVPPSALAEAGDAQMGEDILIVGFPWGRRLGIFSGIVSQVPSNGREAEGATGDGAEPTMLVDASVAVGVSGGGVFRQATGSLLGVVEGYRTAALSVQGRAETYSLNLPVPGGTTVIPVGQIRQFLEAAGIPLP